MAVEIAIVVAFNEEGRVGEVVRGLHGSRPELEVVVVDDGSMDGTRLDAIRAGAAVVSHPFNLGYGAALRTGYLYALGRGAARCVVLDGDGQHDPAAATAVLDPLRRNEADVVIGSRFLVPTVTEMSGLRRLGVRVIALLATLVTGQRWHDAMSGYLGVERPALELLTTDILADDYADLDVLIALWGAGMRIVEVPMTMRARRGGRSMLSGVRILHYVYKMGLSIVMAALRTRIDHASRRPRTEPAHAVRRS